MHDSAWGRLIGALVAPARTFESIARRPTWALAFIVLWVLGAGSSVLAWQKVDPGEVREVNRERMGARMSEMTEEQREQALDQAAKFTPIFAYGCSAVMPPVAYLVSALMLWVALKIAGGTIGFQTSLAVTVHGMMPWALAALLAVPIVLAARFVAVAVPLGALGLRQEFTKGSIPVLTWGGLRGGISVALALSLPAVAAKESILAITYTVVVFSIIVQGLTFKRVVARFVR